MPCSQHRKIRRRRAERLRARFNPPSYASISACARHPARPHPGCSPSRSTRPTSSSRPYAARASHAAGAHPAHPGRRQHGQLHRPVPRAGHHVHRLRAPPRPPPCGSRPCSAGPARIGSPPRPRRTPPGAARCRPGLGRLCRKFSARAVSTNGCGATRAAATAARMRATAWSKPWIGLAGSFVVSSIVQPHSPASAARRTVVAQSSGAGP